MLLMEMVVEKVAKGMMKGMVGEDTEGDGDDCGGYVGGDDVCVGWEMKKVGGWRRG